MTVSVYSCLTALLWFDLAVIVCGCLRMSKHFSYQFGLWPLCVSLVAAGLRLVFPVEVPMTVVIHSEDIFPTIRDTLQRTCDLGGHISFSFAEFLLACWAAGTCISLIRLGLLLRTDYRKIYQLAAMPDAKIQALMAETVGGRIKNYRLIITPEVETPSAGGYFVPFFIIPPYISGLPDDDIRNILRHECQHVLHRDTWTKLMIEVVICCFWWNLPVYLLRRDLDQFLEVNCDLSVIKQFCPDNPDQYLETIYKSIQYHASASSSSIMFSPLFEAPIGFNITQRFALIKKYNKKRNYLVIGAYSIFLVIIWFASLKFVVQPESYPLDFEILENKYDGIVVGGVDDVEGADGDMYLKQKDDGVYVLYVGEEPWFDLTEEELFSGPFSQLPIIK